MSQIKKQYYIEPVEKVFDDEAERKSAYESLFVKNTLGERVLNDILLTSGFYSMSFNKDSAEQTAFNEGKKHVCRDILNILQLQLKEIK